MNAPASWPPLRTSGARLVSDGIVLDRDDLRRALVRIAHEIVETNQDRERVALVGIHSRGAVLARRLRALIEELTGRPVPLGEVDITFYRDDVGVAPDRRPAGRALLAHRLPARGHDRRARRRRALHGPHRAGGDRGAVRLRPPGRVQLAVLVDRGHRELPIRPDYVGKNLPTSRDRARQRPPRGERRRRRGRRSR